MLKRHLWCQYDFCASHQSRVCHQIRYEMYYSYQIYQYNASLISVLYADYHICRMRMCIVVLLLV